MGKLIYHSSASLDGYIADRDGKFDFTAPDEEVHAFVNNLQRDVGTYLFGRNLYEVMSVWETWDTTAEPTVVQDFARIWHGIDKVVYSTTLSAAPTARTRIERTFDPEAVRGLKAGSDRSLAIGGPTLAATALQAGLVDECSLFVTPFVVGGGKKYLPDGLNLRLELLQEHTFGSGTVYLRYRVLP